MTLAGAVVLPAAPVLVPGMSEAMPQELHPVRDTVGALAARLPAHELLVLLAGAPLGDGGGVWAAGGADLGGLSRADLGVSLAPWSGAAELAGALGLAQRDDALPVDLAVLALQSQRHAASPAVVCVAAPQDAGARLLGLGAAMAEATGGQPVVVVAAGDLSAGLTEKAPRHLVEGAQEWDEAALAALRNGDGDALGALGPDEAARVTSRGWSGLVVLLGALRAGGLTLRDVEYAAPRGVGYVLAAT